MVHPDPMTHEKNLALAVRDQHEFNLGTTMAYDELFSFVPAKRPLWKKRNGMIGRHQGQPVVLCCPHPA